MSLPGSIRIGLVGDYDKGVRAHHAIPFALDLASKSLGCALRTTWLHTTQVMYNGSQLASCDGIWCVPGSPYESMDGALLAIRHARENRVPFLGTCGGFQHAVIEYARNVLGMVNAGHAESNPDAPVQLIAPLVCSLVGEKGIVLLKSGSRIKAIYNSPSAVEGYHCRYGLNPEYKSMLEDGHLAITAVDEQGDVRALELGEHPFFVATLFQPELSGLEARRHPLVMAFVDEAVKHAPSAV